jgi:hypothetical protein
MKNDFGLESYAYNQLLQVLLHEKLSFVSLEVSFLFMNRQHPNEPIFFTIQHKSKVFNNIKIVILWPILSGSVDGHIPSNHSMTKIHH